MGAWSRLRRCRRSTARSTRVGVVGGRKEGAGGRERAKLCAPPPRHAPTHAHQLTQTARPPSLPYPCARSGEQRGARDPGGPRQRIAGAHDRRCARGAPSRRGFASSRACPCLPARPLTCPPRPTHPRHSCRRARPRPPHGAARWRRDQRGAERAPSRGPLMRIQRPLTPTKRGAERAPSRGPPMHIQRPLTPMQRPTTPAHPRACALPPDALHFPHALPHSLPNPETPTPPLPPPFRAHQPPTRSPTTPPPLAAPTPPRLPYAPNPPPPPTNARVLCRMPCQYPSLHRRPLACGFPSPLPPQIVARTSVRPVNVTSS